MSPNPQLYLLDVSITWMSPLTPGSPGGQTVAYAEILETTKGGTEESSTKQAPKALRNQGP